jgi:ABC-type bacteriocin/lantibiotic exporter with double-glycine peptidase domain
VRKKQKKINFWSLYKKFKFKVIKHFAFSTICTILSSLLTEAIFNLFQENEIKSGSNFSKLLPAILQKKSGSIGKEKFVAGGIIVASFYALIYYFDNLWEEELRIEGGHYSKNLILDKFRHLPFKEKKLRQDEINNLVEDDADNVGYYWEHLLNHTFHSLLLIVTTLYFSWKKLSGLSTRQIFLSLLWLILLNVINYLFTRAVLHNERKYKKRLTKEWTFINEERNKIILIESMGLDSQYRNRQREITRQSEKLLLDINPTKSLSKAIPSKWLMELFPFLLLFFSKKNFAGTVLISLWSIFRSFANIFYCLWDYASYATSRDRINSFLTLTEKNDNLSGIQLTPEQVIKSIEFRNVFFRYQEPAEEKENSPASWVLSNYNRLFSSEQINYLSGANGTGKSTILYLLLGILVPQEGEIIIITKTGEKYNLHREINLRFWRRNNVAYCSHDNLIKQGSTGQKQLTNINYALETRENSQIFLFDEADNALDKSNYQNFAEKIRQIAEKKIVIYVGH